MAHVCNILDPPLFPRSPTWRKGGEWVWLGLELGSCTGTFLTEQTDWHIWRKTMPWRHSLALPLSVCGSFQSLYVYGFCTFFMILASPRTLSGVTLELFWWQPYSMALHLNSQSRQSVTYILKFLRNHTVITSRKPSCGNVMFHSGVCPHWGGGLVQGTGPSHPVCVRLCSCSPPPSPGTFKLICYETRTVKKRAVDIRLKYLLVIRWIMVQKDLFSDGD